MAPLTTVFPVILTGLIVSLLASWPAAWLANRLVLIDIPGQKAHKRHSSATPMGGGIALAAGLPVRVAWIPWAGNIHMVGIALGALVVLALGLIDDRFDLSVPLKLLGQLAAAVILITQEVQASLFERPLLDLAVTILWVVGIINAFTFVDSMGVALFDTVLVVVSRLRRGLTVYQAGSDHTYHRLRLLRIEPTRGVFAMHLAGIMLGLLAFIGLQSGPPLGNLLLALIVGVGLILLLLFERLTPPID